MTIICRRSGQGELTVASFVWTGKAMRRIAIITLLLIHAPGRAGEPIISDARRDASGFLVHIGLSNLQDAPTKIRVLVVSQR
jgi:hypothetical protein